MPLLPTAVHGNCFPETGRRRQRNRKIAVGQCDEFRNRRTLCLKHATSIRVYHVPDLSGVNSADQRQEERAHKVCRPAPAQDTGVAKFLIFVAAGCILK